MITAKLDREVEKSSNFKVTKFSIKTTGKSFKILSNQLYSDKIMAIVRELSTNAHDSHVSANTPDKTFEVHLPTRFNSTFYIRDFGLGLSNEDMEHVYTTYFESTKEETNKLQGCLGLGSKSPFCYVDVFTVISYYEGMKTTFSAFLDEDGAPSCAQISSVETTEENGLHVQIPVQEKDWKEFQYKAQRVYRYFKIQPEFTGAIPEIRTPTYSVEGDGWGICSDRSRGAPMAIMGQVAYPVNVDSHDLTDIERTFLSTLSVDMHFPIGALEFVPSRETLSYDDKTTKAIRSGVTSIIDFERKRFITSLKKVPTFWEACLFVNSEIKNNVLVNRMFLNETLKWKGRQVNSTNNFITFAEDYFRKKVGESQYESLIKIYQINKKETRNHWDPKITVSRPEVVQRIRVSPKTDVFIDDIGHGSYSRARSYLHDNVHLDRVYYVVLDKPKMAKKFRKQLGVKEVKSLSVVPKPVIVRKPRGEVCKDAIFQYKNSYGDKADKYWREVGGDFDVDEGGFYLPISRWKIESPNPELEDKRPDFVIPHLLQVLKDAGHTDLPPVYGIKKVKVNALKKRSNWINLEEFVDTEARRLSKDADFLHELRMNCFKSNMNSSSLISMIKSMIFFDTEDIRQNKFYKRCRSGDIRKIAREYVDTFKKDVTYRKFRYSRDRMDDLDITLPDLDTYSVEFDKRIKEILKQFPLLEEISGYESEKKISQVLDYINCMELFKI